MTKLAEKRIYEKKLTPEYKALKLQRFIAAHQDIISAYKSGFTLAEVGIKFGFTRQYIEQVVHKCGVRHLEGGRVMRSFLNAADKVDARKQKENRLEQDCQKRWGCTREKFKFFGAQATKGTITNKFKTHRQNAKTRGIGWELTLKEWWDIWQESGHWHERGVGSGKYVMARNCDMGAYSKDNIQIITHNNNSKESRAMDKVLNRKISRGFKAKKYLADGVELTIKEMSIKYSINVNTLTSRVRHSTNILQDCLKPLSSRGKQDANNN